MYVFPTRTQCQDLQKCISQHTVLYFTLVTKYSIIKVFYFFTWALEHFEAQ